MAESASRSDTALVTPELIESWRRALTDMVPWLAKKIQQPVDVAGKIREVNAVLDVALKGCAVSERGLSAAVDLIVREVENARRKHPDWPANDTLFAAAIVSEESGELMRAAVQHRGEGGSLDACDKEAIQTAAVAIRFLERK